MFKEKEKPKTVPPVERVRELAKAGKSEQEISKQLLKEGYTQELIDLALNQALKFEVTGAPKPPLPPPPAEKPGFIAPPPEQALPEKPEEPEVPEEEIALEDLVDEIVTEKISEFEAKLNALSKADSELREELQEIKQNIEVIKSSREEEKTKLLEKIEETSGHVEDIESRIASLEKAFKEFLPTLTENVRALSGIVTKLKEKTKES
jgi:hypothetical protein